MKEKAIAYLCIEFIECNLRLTEYGEDISFNSKNGLVKFYARSGIALERWVSDESAQNTILISGALQECAIDQNFIQRILASENKYVKLYYYYPYNRALTYFATYEFENISVNEVTFELSLVSIATRLNQELLHRYSNVCRANLGDENCAVNCAKYQKTCRIKSVTKNEITLATLVPHGMWERVMLHNTAQQYAITKYHDNKIYIDTNISVDNVDKITLIPTCDKKFSTCSEVYNNSVNFRGV